MAERDVWQEREQLPVQLAWDYEHAGGIKDFLATPAGRKCKKAAFFYAFGWGGQESESFRRAWRHWRR